MLIFMGLAIPTLGYPAYVNQLYQPLGYVQGAAILASCRQGIFFVPLIYALPAILGPDGILMPQVVADALILLFPFHLIAIS